MRFSTVFKVHMHIYMQQDFGHGNDRLKYSSFLETHLARASAVKYA